MELSAGFSPEEPLYVITDMHGCLEAMDRLLSHRPADARLVFLGDAIDRGPDPLGVISVLMTDGRNMLLRVTDPALLQKTGGIVQGMSGSPILQDGKLVGAVTHVLVSDPEVGYGIFIESMLHMADKAA